MKFLLSILVLSFCSVTFAFHPPLKFSANIVDGDSFKSDSGIYGPSFADQVTQMKSLAAAVPFVDYINYGKSEGGRDLSALLFKPSNIQPTNFVIITGAIHGNEYLNIVDQLPQALLASKKNSLAKYLSRGGAVLFVPIVNPDGYDRRRRSNNRWADLNRDWPNPANNGRGFKQVESKALGEWIDNYVNAGSLKVDIVVDYHCCVKGTLLLPWGYKKGVYMNSADIMKSKKIENMFLNAFETYGDIGTPPDVLYSAVGTTLDYWHEKYSAVSFTYEGRRNVENKFLVNHVNWWNQIFDHY